MSGIRRSLGVLVSEVPCKSPSSPVALLVASRQGELLDVLVIGAGNLADGGCNVVHAGPIRLMNLNRLRQLLRDMNLPP